MLFSLAYFLVGCILRTGRRSREGRDVELLVLRHQVRVLQRQVKRPRLRRLDRLLLAAASKAMHRGQWSSFVVRPETLLRWHRELVRRKWTYKGRGRPGRPPIDPEVSALIVRFGTENPRWGYQRIRGELLRQLAQEWANAAPDEKATALGLVHVNETINFALASLFNFVFAAATFILFGLAVALSDVFPRWLGWVVLVAGVTSIGAGLIQAYAGEPTGASRILTIFGPTVITLWLLVVGILLVRMGRSESIDSLATN